MDKPNSPNKRKLTMFSMISSIIVTGIIVSGGIAIYMFSNVENLKSKSYFLVKKSVEHLLRDDKVAVKSRNIIESVEADEEKNIVRLAVNGLKAVRRISPLIYGSNLGSKTEFDEEIIQFGKRIGISNFRFPGGASWGYRWKLSKHDLKDRYDEAPMANIENVIKFCRDVGAKLVIQVNISTGSAQEAAEWVEYMNKNKNMGVEYWQIGNEAYGDWDEAFMSGVDYVNIVKDYSVLMKKADPTIKIGAIWGGPKYQEFDNIVIQETADYIDFISYHWYPNHINASHKYKGRVHPLPEEVMANSMAVNDMVGRFDEMLLKFAPHRKDQIEFTILEWDGSWDAASSDLKHEYKGMMWSLANAIFYADSLGQFAVHGITVASQYSFQEVMFGLIYGWDKKAGWGGSPWDRATIRPKALAFELMANHFRGFLVNSRLTGSPTYYKSPDWRADSYTGQVPYVTSYVSRTSKGNEMAIVLINKHESQDFKAYITLNGIIPENSGQVWILNGPSLSSQNDGWPGTVKTAGYALNYLKEKFRYTIPAHSVNVLKFSYKEMD